MMKMLIQTGIIFALAYVAVTCFIYFTQDNMLYFPDTEILQTPKHINLAYSEAVFETEDGVNISGWYVPARDEKWVLLLCHGNAGNISHRLDNIKVFNNLNLTVFAFDYRGYGKSKGTASEQGTYLDAEAAWNYLINIKHKLPENIIIYGHSLGASIASELALGKNPAGLIIESGFTSIPDIGKNHYPWLPVHLISKYKYATIDKIASIKCNKLIIHSPDDEVIPFKHGKLLYEKACRPKSFLQINGDHNSGFLVSGTKYTEGLKKFFLKLGQ
jgi:uncharacterized protein